MFDNFIETTVINDSLPRVKTAFFQGHCLLSAVDYLYQLGNQTVIYHTWDLGQSQNHNFWNSQTIWTSQILISICLHEITYPIFKRAPDILAFGKLP